MRNRHRRHNSEIVKPCPRKGGACGNPSRVLESCSNTECEDRLMAAQKLHDVQFPNESRDYREARNELLLAEQDLRRQIERVADQRRALPLGGEVPHDYAFDGVGAPAGSGPRTGHSTKLSELFADKQ